MTKGPVRAQHVADAGLTVRLAHKRHEGRALQFVQFTLVKPDRSSRSAARQHIRQAPRDLRVPALQVPAATSASTCASSASYAAAPAAYTGSGCGAR